MKGNSIPTEDSLEKLRIKTTKIHSMDKIKWRYRKNEVIKSTRWNRNHTRLAEHYWFWEIECKNHLMHIPLEEQYDFEACFKEISLPTCKIKFPEKVLKGGDLE